MERTTTIPFKERVKNEVIKHIRAINKHLPEDYLRNLDYQQLLAEVHPTYRDYYAEKLFGKASR